MERLRASGATDLGWDPIGDRVVLRFRDLVGNRASWSGTVALPAPERGWRYGLAVEEHELYEIDESQAEYWEVTASDPQSVTLACSER